MQVEVAVDPWVQGRARLHLATEMNLFGTDRNSPENRWLLDAMQRQMPSSISVALRPVGISPSSRYSSWAGTPNGYELNSHSRSS
jgi:hypothetical protein